ncbi:DUF416 family protein [Streptomyces sp. NPDC050636]|uniref:DUF416 family protein n=1 Tax=Streptomyces sp. NPDC050636 TaxID=3154510 RepID=UPI00341276F1
MSTKDGGHGADGYASWYREEERHLTARLTHLSTDARTTLAALTAVRLLPRFHRFHAETGKGDPDVLAKALDDVWNRLEEGTPVAFPTYQACFDQLSLVGDSSGPLAEIAWYSAAAVTNACHVSVNGGIREALHCLRYGRESALLVSGYSASAPTCPRRHDALLQEEIRRQMIDLDAVAA